MVEFKAAGRNYPYPTVDDSFAEVVNYADNLALLLSAPVEVYLNDFPIFTRTPEQARVRESEP